MCVYLYKYMCVFVCVCLKHCTVLIYYLHLSCFENNWANIAFSTKISRYVLVGGYITVLSLRYEMLNSGLSIMLALALHSLFPV